jgi:hypothetical protein
MKFFAGIALALEVLSLFGAAVVATPTPQPEVVVDRLVSRRSLKKRDSGYSNGGNASCTGLNSTNYELSFYHINDVHA